MPPSSSTTKWAAVVATVASAGVERWLAAQGAAADIAAQQASYVALLEAVGRACGSP